MATQWPLVKARLVTVLPTLPGWDGFAVYPGRCPTGSPPPKYATVGWTSGDEAGGYSFDQDDSGYQWAENGSLYCEINVSSGGEDASVPESLAQAALDGVTDAFRADRRLGVLPAESSASLAVTLAPVANASGTAFIARFALNYLTVT